MQARTLCGFLFVVMTSAIPSFAQPWPLQWLLNAYRQALNASQSNQVPQSRSLYRLQTEGQGPFQIAISNKNIAALAALLKTGEIPDNPQALLRICLEPGKLSLLTLALQNRLDPNLRVRRDGVERTPLQIALLKNNWAAARVLILYGARVEDDTPLSKIFSGSELAFVAIMSPAFIRENLPKLADADLMHLFKLALVRGQLALAENVMSEMRERRMELATLLESCFRLFAVYSNPNTLSFLLTEADKVELSYSHALSLALAQAIAGGAQRSCERLLRAGANPAPVRFALQAHDERSLRLRSWRKELEDRFKMGALIAGARYALRGTFLAQLPAELRAMIAAYSATELSPSARLLSALRRGDSIALANLLEGGAEVEMRDENGHTLLWRAAYHRRSNEALALLRVLLHHGAEINPSDNDQESLFESFLGLSSWRFNERSDVIRLLVRRAGQGLWAESLQLAELRERLRHEQEPAMRPAAFGALP